jgi:hypothetical protein
MASERPRISAQSTQLSAKILLCSVCRPHGKPTTGHMLPCPPKRVGTAPLPAGTVAEANGLEIPSTSSYPEDAGPAALVRVLAQGGELSRALQKSGGDWLRGLRCVLVAWFEGPLKSKRRGSIPALFHSTEVPAFVSFHSPSQLADVRTLQSN